MGERQSRQISFSPQKIVYSFAPRKNVCCRGVSLSQRRPITLMGLQIRRGKWLPEGGRKACRKEAGLQQKKIIHITVLTSNSGV